MISRDEARKEALESILKDLNEELLKKEQRYKELTVNRVKQSLLNEMKLIYKTEDGGADIPEELKNEETILENEVKAIKWRIAITEEYGERYLNKKSR